MIVGEQQVAGVANLEGDRVRAVTDFLLGLRRQELPIVHIVEHELVTRMMLDRHFVQVTGRAGVRDVEAG